MEEIEMITIFVPEKMPTPVRFRVEAEDQSLVVVKIDKVLYVEEDKKEKKIKYRCICTVNGNIKTYDIFYMKESMKWYLKT